ncbi:MAG: hypothetical protein DWQ31_17025 [Planctomycetota bacterium]|nr:MAG: hypothetical protein DWQ31_17025 [Planctomycetota bacterium]REJ92058.1 MAG: hypothetical protein DWQ35_12975 [Planctomycetota bacterium]REK28594.1 MAG: hypothetical protein DWQ42_04565 [Planctomycetota bacterium]REK39209.1 MAG: hypothetical protein DWQ46_18150 [Planctomycetota bacterium]
MTTTLDDSHCELEIPLPKDVSDTEVEVVVELCDRRGEPDRQMKPIVVKEAASGERRRPDADQARRSQTGKPQPSEPESKQKSAKDTPKPSANEVAK